MNNIKKILIPTDFSSASEMALSYAAQLVQTDRTIKVVLLHVVAPGTAINKQEDLLIDLVATHREKIPTLEYSITSGDMVQSVLEFQKQIKADLIIMGTKGSTEEESVAITNTAELVRAADCCVLVIPPRKMDFAIKNIALALGAKEMDDSGALGVLFDIARTFDAKIHILSIMQGAGELPLNDRNESILEYYFETLDYQHVFPENTDIEKGISDYVRSEGIDLLAIMPENHAKKQTPSEGRLTKLLTMHAQVPLLTID